MTSIFLLVASSMAAMAGAQNGRVFLQSKRLEPARPLAATELSQLADPLFRLVLESHADETHLSEIERLIQPEASRRRTFVVDELIRSSRRPGSRRAVIAFTGFNQAANLPLDGNVMLSVIFSSENFPDETDIEAWGWDEERGLYNYYKLDRTGGVGPGATWKFRGSSKQATALDADERRGTCMACHVNGAPIMKELAFPWNNWHSDFEPARYLTSVSPPGERWPVAGQERIGSGRLAPAERFESIIVDSIQRFNRRRVEELVSPSDPPGFSRLGEARLLLRSLFVGTEVNLVSARSRSGLHPLSESTLSGPASTIRIPDSFFLNAEMMGGGIATEGLGIVEAKQFASTASVEPADYRRLVLESAVSIDGQSPGDTFFAWFVPEPSFIDNNLVEELIGRGVLTPEFVAAALAVDLEKPIFSDARARLLALVPSEIRFRPLASGADPFAVGRHPDELARQMIAGLEALPPAMGSPEAEFLELLRSPNPVAELRARVAGYRSRVRDRLLNPTQVGEELKRLFDLAIARRERFVTDPTFEPIIESRALFPRPLQSPP